MPMKISKIISGSPVQPIVVGEPALIHKSDGLCRTTSVVEVRRVSASEIRFETRNTKYVLRIAPVNMSKREAKHS